MAIGGVFFAYSLYNKFDLQADLKVKSFFGSMYRIMENKFFIDEFYNSAIIRPFVKLGNQVIIPFDKKIVDGLVNGSGYLVYSAGNVFRQLQSGLVQRYALLMFLGVVVLLGYVIFG